MEVFSPHLVAQQDGGSPFLGGFGKDLQPGVESDRVYLVL